MMCSSLEPNIKTEPLQPSNQTQNGTIPSLKLGMDPLRSTSLSNPTHPKSVTTQPIPINTARPSVLELNLSKLLTTRLGYCDSLSDGA